MKFKVGDKIRCMNDNNLFPGIPSLTFGREYEVIKIGGFEGNFLSIINDNNMDSFYEASRFQLANQVSKQLAKMLTIRVAQKIHCDVEFIEVGSNYMLLRFMSPTFGTASHIKRNKVILETFKQVAPRVIENYEILFDTFTPGELSWLTSNG